MQMGDCYNWIIKEVLFQRIGFGWGWNAAALNQQLSWLAKHEIDFEYHENEMQNLYDMPFHIFFLVNL